VGTIRTGQVDVSALDPVLDVGGKAQKCLRDIPSIERRRLEIGESVALCELLGLRGDDPPSGDEIGLVADDENHRMDGPETF
jgi:hypothetical protein